MYRTIRKIAGRILTAAVLVAPLAPSAIAADTTPPTTPVVASVKLTSKQVNDVALHGAVWILKGTVQSHQAHGSGWILDVEKKLIVTNEHVISGQDDVELFFPVFEAGKPNRDFRHYINNVQPTKAKVIDRDKGRDLAVLQVESIPAGMKALKLASEPAEEGDEVRSVGGLPKGNEALWGTVRGEVRLSSKMPNANGGFCQMMLSDISINPGNSGGAVVNDRGEVVAVVEGERLDARNVTMHVDLTEIKAYLTEATPLVEPKDAVAFMTRGERRLNQGRIDAAGADFGEAIKKDSKLAKAYVGRGKTFAARGDFATAIGDFDDAIKLDDQAFDAFIARGKARAKSGKTEDAIADMTKAIRIDPKSIHGYNDRGNIYFDLKNFKDAAEDYTRAIRISPNDVVLIANRGNAYESLGNITEAIADFKELIRLEPNVDHRWGKVGNLLLWDAKKPAEARVAFIKAAELNPKEAVHLANIADSFLEEGNNEKAVQAFNESFKLNEQRSTLNIAYTHYRRGLALKGIKDNDAALADFSKAIAANPKFAFAYLERGRLLEQAGKETEAKADLEQAGKLNPNLIKKIAKEEVTEKKETVKVGLLGSWVFDGHINGLAAYEKTTLHEDGSVTTTARLRGTDGVWREINDSGTFTITGNRVSYKMQKLGIIVRNFELHGSDRLTISDISGMSLDFERAK